MKSRTNKRKSTGLMVKRIISILFILAGISLLVYPFFTDAFYSYQQNQLRNALPADDDLENIVFTDPEEDYVGRLMYQQFSNEEREREKEAARLSGALFLLKIPSIDIDTVILNGTSVPTLRKAPGFYEISHMPGEGNTAIAGHRNTYGAPFARVNELDPGDEIFLTYGQETFIYEVERVFVIANNDWSVIDNTTSPALTLTTCHPVGSSEQRMVVRAMLVDQE